jgi:heme exporter protein C
VAFLDAPIVFFSIRWWRDQHPSAMIDSGDLAAALRPAFYTCLATFLILLTWLMRRRYFLESARQELERLERQADLSR